MELVPQLAEQLSLPSASVKATVELLDQGATLPFVARYRKEVTGGLDEEQLRRLAGGLHRLRALDERRQTVLASIEEQGKLTPELRQRLLAATSLTELEDLYQPYRPKRRTRASMAREKGLQPLADLILEQPRSGEGTETTARAFLSEEVPDVEEALAGARDIVAQAISDDAAVRGRLREKARRWGLATCQRIEGAQDERRVYELYYDFESRVDRLRPYQVLALNRGEREKVLRVGLDVAERNWRGAIESAFRPNPRSPFAGQLHEAIEDAAKRLLLPAIERDVRRLLTEQAQEHAISVFASNLRALLAQPPLAGHTVLGIDPAYRTGCKLAVVDSIGKVLETATVYPHEPQRQRREALATLAALITRHHVTVIAIGNGTASRETEQLVAELTRQMPSVRYLIVNEAGASVYSASSLARAELPDLDVAMRGAVSIARRVQDPLAELVKVDPKSVGVGMYQHDVDQKQLEAALDAVVETVVNRVGVDVNTASPALLARVAGIGPRLAEQIVAHRDQHGPFRNHRQLLKVKGLGPKAFEQAAGFLRIRDGDNPLDASAIHPESYAVAEKVLSLAGLTPAAPPEERAPALRKLLERRSVEDLAREVGAGVLTLQDILEQLVRPGRDPREDLPAPILRTDVLSMDDLAPGMVLQGTVRNVVDFGAFVDIGVKQDGLLHRSQIPQDAALSVGDVIQVQVLSVKKERGRIGLGWVEGSAADR